MKDKPKNPMGRPSTYTPQLAKRICDIVSTSTLGYRRLETIYPELPDENTVRVWRINNDEFRVQYAQAKALQCELLAEEMLDIADDARNDWMETLSEEEALTYRANVELINRSRLRIDTRKFLASKLLPKKYGDTKQLEELQSDNERYKRELEELREQLDSKNRKEY